MTFCKCLRSVFFPGLCLFLFTLPASVARADIATLTIGAPNTAMTCCTGPYATVQIDRVDATHAVITFASDTNGDFIYLIGASGAADLNVNGSYALGGVTESNSLAGFTSKFKDNKPGEAAGFGKFNLSLDNSGGFTDSATRVSFTITNTSGAWPSASRVLTPNRGGFEAAVHVFACAEPGCSTSSRAFKTGFSANDPPTNVPEPAGAVLLASSMIGVLMRRRSVRVPKTEIRR
ncbi:MAG TPA: hypothetical protein VLI55_08835 [Bryobacteraceae bacterium]|nr:hypothetical protein [Bryobacteraceae bacterium]